MIDYENSLNPYDDIRVEIEMASSLANNMVTHDEIVYNMAKEFESKGIKPRGSLHLACAVKGDADYFLTCDDKLIKKVSTMGIDLKIMNPIRFVEEMEEK